MTVEKRPLSVSTKLGVRIKWVTVRDKIRSLGQDKANTTVCKKRLFLKRTFTALGGRSHDPHQLAVDSVLLPQINIKKSNL